MENNAKPIILDFNPADPGWVQDAFEKANDNQDMKNNAKPLALFIVIDDKGKVWQSSTRRSSDECIIAFIGEWLGRVRKSLTTYRAGVCWDMFEECGWKVIEIEVPITTETI